METCKKCGVTIPEGYAFMCTTCGFEPMCDACYYDHITLDQHDECEVEQEEDEELLCHH